MDPGLQKTRILLYVMRMKKTSIFVGAGLAVAALAGLGIWLMRPAPVNGPVQEPVQSGSMTTVDKTDNVANEDVLLIEGGTATSENFMMVTNPPKK